jgi:hypothetical protein
MPLETGLYLDGDLVDASRVEVPAGGQAGVEFTMEEVPAGTLMLKVEPDDDFALDNVAYVAVDRPRRAKVLVVSPGNEPLETALETDEMLVTADVSHLEVDRLPTPSYLTTVRSGSFDLVIYDQCVPPEMPPAHTLFIGAAPPGPQWKVGPKQAAPQIIDTDRAHPIMQFVELGNVTIAEASPLEGPRGSHVLIDSDAGPLLVVGPREGFEDAVLGFGFTGTDDRGATYANTDWPIRVSFPLFIRNLVRYSGGTRVMETRETIQPGQLVRLKTQVATADIRVVSPDGAIREVSRRPDNTFTFGRTDKIGVYQVRESPESQVAAQRFAVNLFNRNESDIRPRPQISTQFKQIETAGSEVIRREMWKWLLLLALGLLLLEWYVYNRRVYI